MSKGVIVYIGGFKLPDKNAAANRVMANAEIFAKLGYSTVLIGIDRNISYGKDVTIIKIKSSDKITCWVTPYPRGKKDWLRYLTSINEFRLITSKYKDIKAVIVYNYQSMAFAKISKYCLKNNIELISDCTEWYDEKEGNMVFHLLKYLDTTIRMKVLNKRVDALILATNYLRNYYKDKKVAVIPTLISMQDYKEPVYTDSNPIRLIYAGTPFRLGKPLKNRNLAKDRLDIAIRLLYKAHKKGVKFIFDIYGITKEQYLEVLSDDTGMLQIMKDSVFFHGRRSNKEIQNLIRKADLSLLLRDKNRRTNVGFPTKFTESINCNVPVITTYTSDLIKYLIETKNGFFIDIKREDLDEEKFIKILSLNADRLKEMKIYCFKSNIFNIENWIEEVELLFAENR